MASISKPNFKAFVAGGDPAFSMDFFGYNILGITDDKEQPRIRIVKLKMWDQIDWQLIKREMYGDYRRYEWQRFLIDQSNARALISDLQAMHIRVEGYKFTAPSKHALVQNLELMLTDNYIEWPKRESLPSQQHVAVLNELIQQLGEQDELHERAVVQYRHPANRHDDLFWAFCLALYAAKQYIVKAKPKIAAFRLGGRR